MSRPRAGVGVKARAGKVAALASRLDMLLENEDLADALAAVRTLELKLKHRLASRTRPLDLFVLPLDIPPWRELKLDLIVRAIVQTGSVRDAAKLVKVGRSSIYRMIEEGELDEHIRSDIRLARVVADCSAVARTQLRHNDRADPAAPGAPGEGADDEGAVAALSALRGHGHGRASGGARSDRRAREA